MNTNKLTQHSKVNLPSEWFAKCTTDDEKEELKQYILNSQRLWELLKGMIQKRYDTAMSAKVTDYDSASWSHKQAHRNGKAEAFEEIFKLLP